MKRIYNQPEVQVAQVVFESMVLAVSPAGGGDTLGFIDEDGNQW